MALRVGIIGGTGHIGYVTEGLAGMDDARLCAIAVGCPDEDPEILKKRARPGADVAVYDDYRKMLDAEKLDVVSVATHFHKNAEVSAEALRRGVAVFSEKPLAITHESLRAAREAYETSRAPVGIMLDFRYRPAFHTARLLVERGVIGAPTVGYSQKSYKRGNRPDFYKKRETYGGIIPWVGIHAIDWHRWVCGRRFVAVSARHSKLHRFDYPDMEDAATCLFEMDNGGTAVMSFDYLRPTGAATHGDDRLRLLGEKGAIEIPNRETLILTTEAGEEEVALEAPERGIFADFAQCLIDGDHACAILPEEAFRITEICLLARDAADRGERVVLI